MRAIEQTEVGGPEVLKVREVADPKPAAGEILVRVRASGLNPVDAAVRSGNYQLLGQPPFIIGWDVSGVVEAVNGTSRFAVGDEVYGMPLFPKQAGAYAEMVAAPAEHFALKPKAWTHEEAAAVPLAGLSAWQALVVGAGLKAGERVLLDGAGGGVGHLAAQIAKAQGAYVIATASTGKLEFVRGLGADEVIDYTQERFEEVAGPVDVAFEMVSAANGLRALTLLREGGRLATIVGGRDKDFTDAAGAVAGVRFIPVGVRPSHEGLEALAKLAEAGKLRPVVAQSFPLAEAPAAHIALAQKPAGKIVLTL